ncbi:MAG TPA: hypothetical protein VMS17_13780 [Gemmataceae bacterium]|nr:hypothetical protein [Gemmataceae bacterium]
MKPLTLVGLIVALVGVGLLFWQGVAFFTTQEPVAQAGPFTLWAPVQHAVWLGPIIGGVVLAVGVVLMIAGAARKAT